MVTASGREWWTANSKPFIPGVNLPVASYCRCRLLTVTAKL